MARIYSRKKGKSGSTTPSRTTIPAWVSRDKEEVEKLVIKLAKQGYAPEKIGIILRDSYGVPSVKLITKKRIAKIMQENDVAGEIPSDLFNLMKKAVNLREHLKSNKKDLHNKRALSNTEMKIKRLMEYYRNSGKLPADWKYTPEKARVLVSGGK